MTDETSESVLISRAVGGDATRADWDELTARAEDRPRLWRTLGESLRDHAGAARAVEAAARIADSVEIPMVAPPRAAPAGDPPQWGAGARRWSGWAVAAAVGLAWMLTFTSRPAPVAQPSVADILPTASADDLFEAYVDRGRRDATVIGEVPERIVVDSRSAPGGEGYELLYLRQILERAVVPDLYQFNGQDETGRPVLVKYEQPDRPM